MSTNKVTENTPPQENSANDALIAIGATVSVLVLGGVLQMISPKTEKIASESAVSQSLATYSEQASTTEENGKSLEMKTSESIKPVSEEITTETGSIEPVSEMTEENSFTSTETVAAAPMMAVAKVSRITDEAIIQKLNSQVYEKIDQNWTTYPTFTENLVYLAKVTETGSIASYESITQAAVDYRAEIPLPNLIESDSTLDKMAEFVVVFTPSGELEVSPWISN